MPKNRDFSQKGKPTANRRKLTVGSRKSGRAGHKMSTADLIAAYDNKSYKKSRGNIISVLTSRGITYPEITQSGESG